MTSISVPRSRGGTRARRPIRRRRGRKPSSSPRRASRSRRGTRSFPSGASKHEEITRRDPIFRWPPTLLRGTPGVAVAVSGPKGSQTQVRIRGAEANHTLLFVDGIRFNDPAAGNEAALRASDQRRSRRGSTWCAARNRPFGDRKRSAAWSPPTPSTRAHRPSLEALAEYGVARQRPAFGSGLDGPPASSSCRPRAGWQKSEGFDFVRRQRRPRRVRELSRPASRRSIRPRRGFRARRGRPLDRGRERI